MANKPDVPCADCGKLLYTSPSSLPPGQRRCQPCRKLTSTAPEPQFTCARCGGPKWSGGDRPCRTCSFVGSRKARPCEVCSTVYKPTHSEQRTCGRDCGDTLRYGASRADRLAARPGPRPKATQVKYVNCAACDQVFIARRGSSLKCCSGLCTKAAVAGLRIDADRMVACGRCHQDITAEFVARLKRYCQPCGAEVTREQRRVSNDKRRAVKRAAFVANVSRKKIYERDQWRCGICRKPVRKTAVVPHPQAPVLDHVIPLAAGGTHEPANVQCAHFLCNSLKGAGGGGEQLRLIG